MHRRHIKFPDISRLVVETNFYMTLPLISSDFNLFIPAERIRSPLIFSRNPMRNPVTYNI